MVTEKNLRNLLGLRPQAVWEWEYKGEKKKLSPFLDDRIASTGISILMNVNEPLLAMLGRSGQFH